jgi:hypothetical protein
MEQGRPELLGTVDATIDDAVKYADPLALRGALFQLTGDQSATNGPIDTRLTRTWLRDPASRRTAYHR